MESARSVKTRGRGGVMQVKKSLHGCANENIMDHNLLHEVEAWSWVPFQILVPQGAGEASSEYHVSVQPCYRCYILTINLSMHMQNGFVHFRCQELTQIYEFKQGLFSKACHQQKEQTERNVSFVCGVAYRYYSYFYYPNEPGAYPLVHACSFARPSIQIWRWWWNQSGFTIRPKWERHLLSPIHPSPDVPTPIIFCDPFCLWVFHVSIQRGSLVERGIGAHH